MLVLVSPPPPSVHAVRWERTLLGGCPLLFRLLLAPVGPPLPLGHAVRWERTMPGKRVSPFLWDWSAHRRRARSVPFPLVCLLICLAWGFYPLLVGHAMRWERMLPYRGVPPLFLALAMRQRAQSAPPPSYPHAVCARGWGGGILSSTMAPSAGGVPVLCAWGLPPVLLLHASGARCWSVGSPTPSTPLRPLVLGAGCGSGGPLVSVRPTWGPRAPCACWGPPSGSGGPPHGGFPCWSSRPPPLHCTPWACAAGWGFPLSLPPLFGRLR